MIYTQRDPSVAHIQLGPDGPTMYDDGCLVTDLYQALQDAGWTGIGFADFVNHLVTSGAFTDSHYLESHPGKGDGQAGLLIWGKLFSAFHQFHDGGSTYHFVEGTWGRFRHWVLKYNGGVTDPFFGLPKEPAGFVENGVTRTLDVQAPEAMPVSESSQPQIITASAEIPVENRVTENLKPDAEWKREGLDPNARQNRAQVGYLQHRLVQLGFLEEADLGSGGLGQFGPKTTAAVVAFQVKAGIMPKDASFPKTYGAGWVGPATRNALYP